MKSYLVFSLFTIVRFQNDMCLTASGGNGTCKFKRICSQLGHLKFYIGSVFISCRKELMMDIDLLCNLQRLLSCLLKLSARVNLLLHAEQLNGFSPVWVLSCIFKTLNLEHL